MALAGAEAELRRRGDRRRRPRARGRVLSREDPRHPPRRRAGARLARRRQHRAQHHDRPLQLLLPRKRGAVRFRAAPVRAVVRRAELQHHAVAARHAEHGAQRPPDGADGAQRERDADQRHRRGAARRAAGARRTAVRQFLRRRPLPDFWGIRAAPRRHRAARRGGVGLCARGRRARRRHRAELRGPGFRHRSPDVSSG